MSPLTSYITQQVRSRAFVPVESTIPVGLTIEQWRRRSPVPAAPSRLRVSRSAFPRFQST